MGTAPGAGLSLTPRGGDVTRPSGDVSAQLSPDRMLEMSSPSETALLRVLLKTKDW
jgi:hypothetical protein